MKLYQENVNLQPGVLFLDSLECVLIANQFWGSKKCAAEYAWSEAAEVIDEECE